MFHPTARYIPANCDRCGDEHDIDSLADGLCMACEADQVEAEEVALEEAREDV